MNKTIKTILILFTAFLGFGFISVLPINAQPADSLLIEFEQTPLFKEANFLPGNNVARQIKVTNNTGETKPIATEAINWFGFPDSGSIPADDLSRVLNIVIKEKGGSSLYGPATLFDFYKKGETYLSDIADGSYKEYEFDISFSDNSGDDWQAKGTKFDIIIGSLGPGGITNGTNGVTTDGGGGLPRGLIIYEPVSVTPGNTSALIEWDTSYESTSQVVYASEGENYSFNLNQLNYGYPYAYPDPEDTTKVKHHQVLLTGLTSGVTYYYRCISHGSFALSTEYSFTTLTEDSSPVVAYTPKNEITAGESAIGGREFSAIEQELPNEEEPLNKEEPLSQNEPSSILSSLFAAMGLQNTCWILILLIVVLIILFFLTIKKGKIDQKKICWLLPLGAIAAFVIYCLYCPYCWLVGIIIAAVSLVVYIAIMLKA
ncbi:MAG: fibronectin type III domain-containing protein [Syntrophales bacterium]|nr:fibronectin type III domain-containing protein [Syntrophales bacterium]